MAKKFVDVKTTDGARIMLNLDCTAYVSATHGTNMADGVDIVLMTLNEEGAKEVAIPASQVDKLLKAIAGLDRQFVKVTAIGSGELYLNTSYVSNIEPLHGNDFSDGATVHTLGLSFPVSSSSAVELMHLAV